MNRTESLLARRKTLLAASAALLALSMACGTGGSSSEPTPVPSPVANTGPAPAGGDISPAALASVRSYACPANAFACDALTRFEAASAPAPTDHAYALVGRAFSTYNAWRGEEVDWFVARPGELMSFGDILPEDETERQQTSEVLALLTAGQPVPSTHPIAGFVQSLATGGQPPHATRLEGRSRHYRQEEMNADVYIRQGVGEILVVKTNGAGAAIGVFRQP
jgi:hypothetical protein